MFSTQTSCGLFTATGSESARICLGDGRAAKLLLESSSYFLQRSLWGRQSVVGIPESSRQLSDRWRRVRHLRLRILYTESKSYLRTSRSVVDFANTEPSEYYL